MALTKPDALRYECVLRNVPITGTNHSRLYDSLMRKYDDHLVGKELRLVRVKNNPHDPSAVMVCFGNPIGDNQVGWIGQQTGHSAKVADLMDADANPLPGAGFIWVTQHRPSAPSMGRMYGDVYLPIKVGPAPPPPPPLNGPVISDIFTSGSERADLVRRGAAGQLLRLVTNEGRVSVSLQDAVGNTLGWYRKAEYPKLADPHNLNGLYALVISATQVRVIKKAEAEQNGYVLAGGVTALLKPADDAKLVADAYKIVTDEYGAQTVQIGGRQVGHREQHVRQLLSIPKTLLLQDSVHQSCWLISEDGEHWLHLIDYAPRSKTLGEAWNTARRYAFDNFTSHYPADFHLHNEAKTQTEAQTQTTKETTMLNRTSISTILSTNKHAATSAAYSEAGRIANNAFASFAASKAPYMVKGYIDTPIGKLLLANIAAVAQRELRPNDLRLQRLTEAMLSQAFVALYQDFDIEGALAKLMDSTEVKRALGKLDESEASTDTK